MLTEQLTLFYFQNNSLFFSSISGNFLINARMSGAPLNEEAPVDLKQKFL